MKTFLEHKAAGFYLTCISTILSLAALISYTKVMYRMPVVFAILGVAIVINVIAAVLSVKGTKKIWNYVATVSAILNAAAAVIGVNLMVNQLGYVVSGLDPVSTVMGFIVFEVIAVLAVILNIVASFFNYGK